MRLLGSCAPAIGAFHISDDCRAAQPTPAIEDSGLPLAVSIAPSPPLEGSAIACYHEPPTSCPISIGRGPHLDGSGTPPAEEAPLLKLAVSPRALASRVRSSGARVERRLGIPAHVTRAANRRQRPSRRRQCQRCHSPSCDGARPPHRRGLSKGSATSSLRTTRRCGDSGMCAQAQPCRRRLLVVVDASARANPTERLPL